MRREVMANAGLEAFAEVGILVFFLVFLAILARAAFMRRDEVNTMLHLPLDETPVEEEVPR